MSTIATAYVQILPSTRGIKQGLVQEFSDIGSSAGSSMGGSMGKSLSSAVTGGALAAVGAAITAVIAKGIKDGVSEAGNLQQSIGGVETLFGDSASTVMQNATEAFKTAGVSANEYMEQVTSMAASLVSSLGGDTEKAAEIADQAIRDMSDNANKMGTPLENIQTAYQSFARGQYQLLDNLKLGYGGTKKEMERLLADAEKFSGVKYDINNLSDVYQAIHTVQKELGITGTTAEEASSTLTGSTAQMKAAWDNLAGAMGSGIDISGFFNDFVSSVGTWGDNIIPLIQNAFRAIPDVIGKMMSSGFMSAMQGLGERIGGLLGTVVTSLVEAGAKFMIVGPAIVANIGIGLIRSIPELIEQAGQMITSLIQAMPQFLPELAKLGPLIIKELAIALIKSIPALISALGECIAALIQAVPEMLSGLKDAFSSELSAIGPVFSSMGASIVSSLSSVGQSISSAFAPVGQTIMSAFAPVIPSVQNLFSQMSGFASACAGLIGAVFAPIGSTLGSIFSGAANSIRSAFASIGSFFQGIGSQILQAFESIVARLRSIGSRMVENLKQGITSAWNNLLSEVKSKIDALAELFERLTNSVNKTTEKVKSTTDSMSQSANSSVASTYSSVSSNSRALGSYSASSTSLSRSSSSSLMSAPTNVTVTLSGSAKTMFDSMRVENSKMISSTGYHALA